VPLYWLPFFIPTAFAAVVNEIFQTRWAHIFDLRALIRNVWSGLFGTFVSQTVDRDRNGRLVREGDHVGATVMGFLVHAFF